MPVLVCDRDHVVAVSGVPRRELLERRVSSQLEEMMDGRRSYVYSAKDQRKLQPIEGVERYALSAAPILAAGDVSGAVMYLLSESGAVASDADNKLIQAAAMFLGKQLEE